MIENERSEFAGRDRKRGGEKLCLHTFLAVMLSALYASVGMAAIAVSAAAPGSPVPDGRDNGQSVTGRIERLSKVNSSCPSPTEREGNHCALKSDVTISATLEMESFTHLDCKKHTIRPTVVGSTTTPQVAFLLRGAAGVNLERCNIEGFDFGILAIQSKSPSASNSITGNTINARFASITLFSVDDTQVSGNSLSFTTPGGHGVLIEMDSDRNEVSGNSIAVALDPAATSSPKLPGVPPGASNPTSTAGAAITVAQIEGSDPTLFNAVVDGALYQFASTSGSDRSDEFTADNRIDGNQISVTGAARDGIVMTVPQRTVVTNNSVTNPQIGIRAGAQVNQIRQFPGTCSLDPARLCLGSLDCNIPGFDAASKGSCMLPPPVTVAWVSHDTIIANNSIQGAAPVPPGVAGAISCAADNTTIQGNVIDGLKTGVQTTPIAIALLGKYAIENTTVEDNTVSEVRAVLRLQKTMSLPPPNPPAPPASFFGVRVSRNVFATYTAAGVSQLPIVLLSNDYDLFPSPPGVNELSEAGKGNYWGIDACPAFDLTKVLFDNGTLVNTTVDHVRDSYPYRDSKLKKQCAF